MHKFSDRKILIGLVLLQAILCLLVIDRFPISLDEPFSIYYSQQSWSEIWSIFEWENNPPLHFLLLHGWIELFGIGPYSVRSLSLLVSLISVFCLYKFGRKLWEKEYVVLLIGLFIFSRLNHYVAMEARMYGLFTLFFILVIATFYSFLFENKRVYVQLGLWNALLLYSHYLGGIVVLLEGLIFIYFVSSWSKQKIIYGLLALAIGVILYLPGLGIYMNRAAHFQAHGSWVSPAQISDLWTNLVKLMNNEFTLISSVLILTLVIVFGKRNNERRDHNSNMYFLIWFLGGFAVMFCVSIFFQSIFFIKYLQFLTIPLFLFLVGIMSHYKLHGYKRFLPFFLVVPFMLSFKPIPDVNRNPDELVDYINKSKTDDCTVFYCPPHYELTLAYHYNKLIFEDYKNTSERMKKAGFVSIYSAEDVDYTTSEILYIDFDSKLLYPTNGILEKLDADLEFISSESFKGGFAIYRFSAVNRLELEANDLPDLDKMQ